MADGYHRLPSQLMEERDDEIIRLVKRGIRHKIIAMRVGLEPAGVEARLQTLRQRGKLPLAGGRNGQTSL